jgi:hypothetical protein
MLMSNRLLAAGILNSPLPLIMLEGRIYSAQFHSSSGLKSIDVGMSSTAYNCQNSIAKCRIMGAPSPCVSQIYARIQGTFQLYHNG